MARALAFYVETRLISARKWTEPLPLLRKPNASAAASFALPPHEWAARQAHRPFIADTHAWPIGRAPDVLFPQQRRFA